MCRYAIIFNKNDCFSASDFVDNFSKFAKTSTAPDGDWQGDGWGMAHKTNHGTNSFVSYKSLDPIWIDAHSRKDSKTKLLIIHARSATFKSQKDDINFNMPFCNDKYCMVFNGSLSSIKIDSPYFTGVTGAQKIWSFMQKCLSIEAPLAAMKKVVRILSRTSNGKVTINLTIVDIEGNMWGYSYYETSPEYYAQWLFKNESGYVLSTGQLFPRLNVRLPVGKIYSLTSGGKFGCYNDN